MRLALAILSFSVGIFFGIPRIAAQVTPSLLIVSPSPGEVVAGNIVPVEVRMPDGFTLVSPNERTEHIEGEGHLHIWLDALPNHADETSVVLIDEPLHTYENVFSGLHTLYAELYRNDHLSYEPRLFDQVEFEIYRENLVPRDENGDEASAPPVSSGGLFLPPEGGNSPAVIVVVIIILGLLWYFFGRKHSKP